MTEPTVERRRCKRPSEDHTRGEQLLWRVVVVVTIVLWATAILLAIGTVLS